MATEEPKRDMPSDFESDEAFGEWFRGKMDRRYGLVTPPNHQRKRRFAPGGSTLWDRVRRVEQRIQAGFPPAVRRRVEIVRMKQMNAFVTPGRYIYVTIDLVRRMATDDALALVVGHELAHAELGHLFEFRRRADWKDLPAGDSFFVLMYLVQKFVSSPQNERDADAYGLDLALRAGYDGELCLEAFAEIERAMMAQRGSKFLIEGPDAAHRPTDDVLSELRARAEVWLYEHLTGYPAIRERRRALAERLAFHAEEGHSPLLLPGSRRSTAETNLGFLNRVQAIDDEMVYCDSALESLAKSLTELLPRPAYRRAVDAIHGIGPGIEGRTAREAEEALAAIQELARQISDLMDLMERSRETRRFLSADNPPQSALCELLDFLFGIPAGPSLEPAGIGLDVNRTVGSPTPRRLLETMSLKFGEASRVVGSLEAAWSRWQPAILVFGKDLDLLSEACETVQLQRQQVLQELVERVELLDRRFNADPLAVDSKEFSRLELDIDAARKEIYLRVVEMREAREII